MFAGEGVQSRFSVRFRVGNLGFMDWGRGLEFGVWATGQRVLDLGSRGLSFKF